VVGSGRSAPESLDPFLPSPKTSKPLPGPERHTYLCDADLRITEGDEVKVCAARLTVHHPRGWMGVAAGFEYDVDATEYPTFDERAEYVHRQVLAEFPSDEIISVFLLGTGESCFPELR
jgi:hypothetical protein